MKKKTQLSRYVDLPLYPWFVAVIPILHLYSNNLGLVIDQDVLLSLVLALLGTAIAFLAINHFLSDRHRTALIVMTCSIAFSLSGHVYALVFMPKSLGIWTLMILSALICIVFLIQRIHSKFIFRQITPVFNLIMFCLLLLQVITLIARLERISRYVNVSEGYTAKYNLPSVMEKVDDSPARPDIYYIVPDSYPSDMWLERAFDYDNSEFTNALEDRGFVIAEQAQSNYNLTYLSVASTLNMKYYFSNQSPFADLDYLRLEIANNLVARQLLQRGYTYIQFLSGFWVPSSIADINRDFTSRGPVDVIVSEQDLAEAVYRGDVDGGFHYAAIDRSYKDPFLPLYIDTTILRLARSQLDQILNRDDGGPLPKWGPRRFLATTGAAKEVAAMPEATFTLVHFIKPHLPTVFDENGNFLERNYSPTREEFLAEFRFLNSQFLNMIDDILETSVHPPIIIFQADHGLKYINDSGPGSERAHLFAYAAYHLPDGHSIDFPEDYTLINTFPLVLNEVLGTTYEMQENRQFKLPVNRDHLFELVDVTDEFADLDEA